MSIHNEQHQNSPEIQSSGEILHKFNKEVIKEIDDLKRRITKLESQSKLIDKLNLEE